MRLRRLYRFVMLAAAGCIVFQTAASCSTDMMNSVTASVSGALNAALATELSSVVTQMFTCPT
jgi:hypothetical protein